MTRPIGESYLVLVHAKRGMYVEVRPRRALAPRHEHDAEGGVAGRRQRLHMHHTWARAAIIDARY